MTPTPRHSGTLASGSFSLGTLVGGRFRVAGLLGSGGSGSVYRAVDLAGSGSVAIKVGAEEGPHATRIRRLIRREAACLARVRHPRIVGLRGVEDVGGRDALVLDLLPGRSLARILADRHGAKLDGAAIAGILGDLGDALACLHRAGFVHGDVKPGNVVVAPDGRATLIDFGTARPVDEPADGRHGDETLADVTPAYAAPGLLAGDPPDPRDDLFSLAVLAWAMMTGRSPQPRGPTPGREDLCAPPGGAAARWIVLRRGLATDRASRPRHADAFVRRLHRPSLADRWVAWGEGARAVKQSHIDRSLIPS